ncbi:MAG: hypothetical protein H6Q99_1903 [Proteobacteria bacterium]|nr:hypothetical protein [Pseudomonadota bacterium]
MLWLVLKYYGFTFKMMFAFTILILSFLNLIYCTIISERLVKKYHDAFMSRSHWPIMKKRNNIPEYDRRRYKTITRIYYVGQFGLMAIFFGVGALAKHFRW